MGRRLQVQSVPGLIVYDYLIVGAGLWGATFARAMLDAGRSVLVIDRRPQVAGNCYTHEVAGVNVHRYGPHIFHTRSRRIWDYVNRFASFNHFRLHGRARVADRIYSMPPGMALFHQLWGVTTPAEAREVLDGVRIACDHPGSLRELVLDAVGEQVYRTFFEGYSRKQWGRDPAEIPAATGRRLPIRLTWSDRWFDDEFEGIPIGGYTPMVERMLAGATVELGVNFLADRRALSRRARRCVYTGRVDAFFGYALGELEYRSLRFEDQVVDGDYQGTAIVTYPEASVPWTRITEHKHFEFSRAPRTVITREYPRACGRGDEPFYPVETPANRGLLARYRLLAQESGVIFGGRLGEHRYYDMDQAIASALKTAGRELGVRAAG